MAVDMQAIEKECNRYQRVISRESAQYLRDMIKYNNSQYNAGIAVKSNASKVSLIKSLVDYHRADEIRCEQKAEGREVVHTISFKSKQARGRFANLYLKGVQCEKEDVQADGYDQVDYDLNPDLIGNSSNQFNLVFKGEIGAEMRKKINSYKSIVSVVSILD